jgi:hypothetical protein
MTEECPQRAIPPCDVRRCPNPGTHRVIDTLDIYGLWGHPIDWKPIPRNFCDMHTREPKSGTRAELGLQSTLMAGPMAGARNARN